MDPVLDALQHFYDGFPLSWQAVLGILILFNLSFALAFREFWAWYSKVSAIRKEVKNLRVQLERIEQKLDSLNSSGKNTLMGGGQGSGGKPQNPPTFTNESEVARLRDHEKKHIASGENETFKIPTSEKKDSFPLTY